MPFAGVYTVRADARGHVPIPPAWRSFARSSDGLYLLSSYEPPRVTTARVFRALADRMRQNVESAPTDTEYEQQREIYDWFLHEALPVASAARHLPVQLAPHTPVRLEGHSSWFAVIPEAAPRGGNFSPRYDAPNTTGDRNETIMPRHIFEPDRGQRATHEAFALVSGVHYGMFQRSVDGGTVMEVLTDYVTRHGDAFDSNRLAVYAYQWFEQGGDLSPASPAARMPWEQTPEPRPDWARGDWVDDHRCPDGQRRSPETRGGGTRRSADVAGHRRPRPGASRRRGDTRGVLRRSPDDDLTDSDIDALRAAHRRGFGTAGRRPDPRHADPTVGRGMDPFGAADDGYYDEFYDDFQG